MQYHSHERRSHRPKFPPTFLPTVAQAADEAMFAVFVEDAGWMDEAADRIPATRQGR